jgi:peptidoglycan/LPS O-acetylase OafA/YrhL
MPARPSGRWCRATAEALSPTALTPTMEPAHLHRPATRIAGLDGIRALCVLMVFIEHFYRGGLGLGGLGVKVFFALSGFLIIGILHGQRVKCETGASSQAQELKRFWVSRALRIFPIYFLVLSLLLISKLAMGKPPNEQGLFYYFAFLGNVYVQHVSHTWGDFSHLWSLSIEQHFYMLASPILLWAPARRHMAIVTGLFLLSVGMALLDFMDWGHVAKPYVPDIPYFAFMACGGWLALSRPTAVRAWLNTWAPALTACAFAFILAVESQRLPSAWLTALAKEGPRGTAAVYVASLILCSASLALVTSRQASLWVKALELRPMRYLGQVSYGFYVYHYFFPAFSSYADSFHGIPHAGVMLTVAQLLATIWMAGMSWRCFERPLLALKR